MKIYGEIQRNAKAIMYMVTENDWCSENDENVKKLRQPIPSKILPIDEERLRDTEEIYNFYI